MQQQVWNCQGRVQTRKDASALLRNPEQWRSEGGCSAFTSHVVQSFHDAEVGGRVCALSTARGLGTPTARLRNAIWRCETVTGIRGIARRWIAASSNHRIDKSRVHVMTHIQWNSIGLRFGTAIVAMNYESRGRREQHNLASCQWFW